MSSAAQHHDRMQITTPGDLDIVITRFFDAPRPLVFDAMTRPELLKRWLGVQNGWTLAVCEIDLRVGGTYRYVWHGPNGEEMGMGGRYLEIAPPERIVTTEKFDQAWYPGDAVDTLVLTEQGEQTLLTFTIRCASSAARDAMIASPMAEGMGRGYEKLAIELVLIMKERTG